MLPRGREGEGKRHLRSTRCPQKGTRHQKPDLERPEPRTTPSRACCRVTLPSPGKAGAHLHSPLVVIWVPTPTKVLSSPPDTWSPTKGSWSPAKGSAPWDSTDPCGQSSAPSQVMLPPERAEGARRVGMLNLNIFPGQVRTLLHCIYTAGLRSRLQAAAERALGSGRGSGTGARSPSNTELSSTEQNRRVRGRSDVLGAKSHPQAAPPALGALQATSYPPRVAGHALPLGLTHPRSISGASVRPLWHRSSSRPAQRPRASGTRQHMPGSGTGTATPCLFPSPALPGFGFPLFSTKPTLRSPCGASSSQARARPR